MKYILKIMALVGIFFVKTMVCDDLSQHKNQVGLLVVATGKYVQFVQPLIDSAERFFLPDCKKTYFIFTDHIERVSKADNVVPVFQKRLGWPYDTMMRCHMYVQHQELYNDLDYMFACDADMRFVDTVGDEILSDIVATQHPGFVGRRGSYETNQNSLAYVAPDEGGCYFAGGFYGGLRQEFIILNQTLYERIKIDLDKGIMPVWHDESHLNRYFIEVKPTKILSPSYCYPEGWNLNFHPRLIALNKNHAQMREN
jgi:histo-blood group ABO system transferase